MSQEPNDKKRRLSLGQVGEDIAAGWLSNCEVTLLARNFRNGRLGEIDIIAQDKSVLLFVEVKTRRVDGNLSATEHTGQLAVDRRKRQKITSTAFAYLRQHPTAAAGRARLEMRFDLILVDFHLSVSELRAYIEEQDLVSLSQKSKVTHLKEIF